MSQSPRKSLTPENMRNGTPRSSRGDSPPRRSPTPDRRSRSRSVSRKDKDRYYSRSRSRSESRRYRSSRYSRSRSRSYSPYRSGGRKRYYSDRRRRSHSRSPMSNRRRHMGSRENPEESRILGVFGLSIYTTEKELHHIFSKYGPLEKVTVVLDAQSGRSRGFSFVYFENPGDASAAKENCTGMEIDGRRIRVDYSITHRPHTPTPGIYMGRPTKGSGYRRSPSPYYKRRRNYDRYDSRYENKYERYNDRYSDRYNDRDRYSDRYDRYERSRSRSYSPRRYSRY